MKRSNRPLVLLTCVLAVLPAGACHQGFSGTVNSQLPSGNGTHLSQGDISVQNAVIVAGAPGSDTAAFSFTMVNGSVIDDSLESITVAAPATVDLAGPLALPARNVLAVGGPNETQIALRNLGVATGSYTEVTFKFREAGELSGQVMVVTATGGFARYSPPAAPAQATADAEDEAAQEKDAQ